MNQSDQVVLVWGACGFIGRHLVDALCRQGSRVAVLTRSRGRYSRPPWHDRVEWFELTGGPGDASVMERAVARATVVYHLAGSTGAAGSNREPVASLEDHNRQTIEMLEACRRALQHPHVVFTSSRLVYGRPLDQPVPETHPLAPDSMYAANKLCCEHYHQVYSRMGAITHTIARISNVYGREDTVPGKPHGVSGSFIRRSLDGLPITLFGDGRQLRDYIYIDDLVSVLIACGQSPERSAGRTFNVGSGVGVSLADAATSIARACGGPRVEFAPWPPDLARVETGDYVSDISSLQRALGFAPRWSFEDGLAMTVAAYREQAFGAA
jgi:nucleoside-diphosphate-sugar epimerase